MYVIDISDPTNPGSPIKVSLSNSANGVHISGDYAYLAVSSLGFGVVNISDPTNPGIPVYKNMSGYAYDVYVSGNYAYVADRDVAFAIFDISDPTNPSDPLFHTTTFSQFDVHVSGDYAYIAASFSGLAVVQVRQRIDMVDPIITNVPNDFFVELGYSGESTSWTATDLNPGTYTVELQGSGVVAGPTSWSSGGAINFNIPDGLDIGAYNFTIFFEDAYDNDDADTVTITIQDTTAPVITDSPNDFTINSSYTEETISWTATDFGPNTYTIDLEGTGVVAGPTAWSSGVAITFDIPEDLSVGDYNYTANFTDGSGHNIIDTVRVTVRQPPPEQAIPYGNYYLIFLVIGIIALVFVQTRRKHIKF